MLNRQDAINALNNAISDTLSSLGFAEKEAAEKQLLQQTVEKISKLFDDQLIQLEKK